MKVVVTATGKTLDSQLDQRFGRADFFLIVDSDNLEFEVVDNSATATAGGAGITSAQSIVEKGVQAVITGNVGPNALSVLKAAEIPVYKGQSVSVRENIEQFNQGALEKLDAAVAAHFGMGQSR